MKLKNPFLTLSRGEWFLLIGSLIAITASFVISLHFPVVEVIACYLGVIGLVFIAKGHPFGQILGIGFALCYGYVSLEYHYYGEMITYVCMTLPINVVSLIAWLRHPHKRGSAEVHVAHFGGIKWLIMALSTAAVTTAFYFILMWCGTNNLIFSTISIATSFSASFLMLFRSPWYAIAYGCNDIVLIILWILASIEDFSYFPMIICIAIFFINDMYGFYNWRRIHKRQKSDA